MTLETHTHRMSTLTYSAAECTISALGSFFGTYYGYFGKMAEGLGAWAVRPFSALVSATAASLAAKVVSRKMFTANLMMILQVGLTSALGAFIAEQVGVNLLKLDTYASLDMIVAIGSLVGALLGECRQFAQGLWYSIFGMRGQTPITGND